MGWMRSAVWQRVRPNSWTDGRVYPALSQEKNTGGKKTQILMRPLELCRGLRY